MPPRDRQLSLICNQARPSSAMTEVVEIAALSQASDYLGLTPNDRYALVSQCFPQWLLTDPIEFPRHDPTFGWACRVDECQGSLRDTETRMLCSEHARKLRRLKDSFDLDAFIRDAEPSGAHRFGWALARKNDCGVCGTNREAQQRGYCQTHSELLRKTLQRGIAEDSWWHTQQPFPPFEPCLIPQCVHDGELNIHIDGEQHRICRTHRRQYRDAQSRGIDAYSWSEWLKGTAVRESVSSPDVRGQLSLAALPLALQQEIRYALHRHRNTARRSQWRPTDIQEIVDILASSQVATLNDPLIEELSRTFSRGSQKRRILLDLPFAARSLMVTDETAKAAGWFDPVIVGSTPFPGTQGHENRRRPWNLTMVSQRWLRDLLWDHLRDEALKPVGKQPSAGTIYNRISGIILLSRILRQNRTDHGEDPHLITSADAKIVKDTWDLWYREQIPIPRMTETATDKPGILTDRSRHIYMSSIRIVMRHSRLQQATPPDLDSFILNLPEYPRPSHNPRPRPLTYDNFRQLVSPDNITGLEDIDHDNVGLADIWLTQAFQGGRISETLKLRVGCLGLVGKAQPYIWRDITKAGVVDYGMPCHLPIYERLLRRQEITRDRLRARYAEHIAHLDEREIVRLEAAWDREMPLFPSNTQNPDLHVEVSQSWFRDVWTEWLEGLGLKGITTHQTRATLATSLLNNGAPAELVRQLLGHFSHEALAHYANYSNDAVARRLQQVWVAGPGVDKPGTILLRPNDITTENPAAASSRIDLTIIPVEHGLCRYGPVVGGAGCPFSKNCTDGINGPCEHFVLTGADLSYWERKRDAAYHFAEGAPTDDARDYILSRWHPWESVLAGLREALGELGLLEAAENLDLRSPVHDYFDPIFATGWTAAHLNSNDKSKEIE